MTAGSRAWGVAPRGTAMTRKAPSATLPAPAGAVFRCHSPENRVERTERRCSLGFNWIFHGSYSLEGFDSGGLDFEHPGTMFELIASVHLGVVGRAGLPHLPEDFQPALAQATQRAG